MTKLPLGLMLLTTTMSGWLYADPVMDRMRDQLRQTVTQMRQLEDENLSLKAQLANVVPVKAAPVVAKVNTVELNQLRSAARREVEKASNLQKQLDETRAQTQQLQMALNQANANSKTQQQVALALDGQIKIYNQKYTRCEDSNKKMLTLANELINLHQQQSFWQALGNHETVTGLYRVKLENVLQDYDSKVTEATVAPLITPTDTSVDESTAH
jgi:chromosome segregation ATPase